MTTTTGERQFSDTGAGKFCTGCGEYKPLEGYHRQSDTRDGRRTRCRVCVSDQATEYRARNRDELRVKAAEYRARPGNRERARATTAAWRKRKQEAKQ